MANGFNQGGLGGNPFLQSQNFPGVGNISTPTPLFNQQGQFNPVVNRAAGQFAQQQMNAVQQFMARRGLQDSSFLQAGLGRAFQSGFDRAVGSFQQQQQLFANLAQQQLQLQAQAQMAEQQTPSFLQATATGALAGGAFGPVGAGIGAGIGALASVFDLV
jgi:hypothetical protein